MSHEHFKNSSWCQYFLSRKICETTHQVVYTKVRYIFEQNTLDWTMFIKHIDWKLDEMSLSSNYHKWLLNFLISMTFKNLLLITVSLQWR